MAFRALAGVAAAVVMTSAAAAAARAQDPSSRAPAIILDVPYIQQSEALCGGAAAAMVMRYWGATGIYAEHFSPIVDTVAGGIRGDALLSSLRARGWDARSFRGDGAFVRTRLASRQPVIALIEDRPDVFHYVVIVAWTNARVVVHDPARAPFRVLDEKTFEAAWEKSGWWTLLTLPGNALKTAAAAFTPAEPSRHSAPSACTPLVDEALRAAADGAHDRALQTLHTASDLCPGDAAPWREMAGVYAVQENWPKAAAHARAAITRDKGDAHSWRILATSSFVAGERETALTAWNRVGEPRIDLVTVQGLARTRHAAATALMGLKPEDLLTPGALAAANRRLDELPAAQSSRVTYRPLPGGRTAVDAVVLERARAPTSLSSLAVVGAHMLSEREAMGWFANPTGAGDLLGASYRWWENRPRISVAYATPTAVGGVLRVEGFWDQQTYQETFNAEVPVVKKEVRKGGAVSLSNWTTSNLRWEVGAALEAWNDRGHTMHLTAEIDQRLASDRLSLQARAGGLTGSFEAWTSGLAVHWRSSPRHEKHVVLARFGLDHASRSTPLGMWAGAGSGHARSALLRAHPLLDDGIITGDIFGRRLYFAGSEWRRWFKPGLRIVPIAPALFVDAARATRRLEPGEAWHLDAGGGIRVAVPGSGVMRLDVAKGLRDGNTVLSIGWMR